MITITSKDVGSFISQTILREELQGKVRFRYMVDGDIGAITALFREGGEENGELIVQYVLLEATKGANLEAIVEEEVFNGYVEWSKIEKDSLYLTDTLVQVLLNMEPYHRLLSTIERY